MKSIKNPVVFFGPKCFLAGPFSFSLVAHHPSPPAPTRPPSLSFSSSHCHPDPLVIPFPLSSSLHSFAMATRLELLKPAIIAQFVCLYDHLWPRSHLPHSLCPFLSPLLPLKTLLRCRRRWRKNSHPQSLPPATYSPYKREPLPSLNPFPKVPSFLSFSPRWNRHFLATGCEPLRRHPRLSGIVASRSTLCARLRRQSIAGMPPLP